MALLLITHDLGVVRELCERAIVLYAGRVVGGGAGRPTCSRRPAIRTRPGSGRASRRSRRAGRGCRRSRARRPTRPHARGLRVRAALPGGDRSVRHGRAATHRPGAGASLCLPPSSRARERDPGHQLGGSDMSTDGFVTIDPALRATGAVHRVRGPPHLGSSRRRCGDRAALGPSARCCCSTAVRAPATTTSSRSRTSLRPDGGSSSTTSRAAATPTPSENRRAARSTSTYARSTPCARRSASIGSTSWARAGAACS